MIPIGGSESVVVKDNIRQSSTFILRGYRTRPVFKDRRAETGEALDEKEVVGSSKINGVG